MPDALTLAALIALLEQTAEKRRKYLFDFGGRFSVFIDPDGHLTFEVADDQGETQALISPVENIPLHEPFLLVVGFVKSGDVTSLEFSINNKRETLEIYFPFQLDFSALDISRWTIGSLGDAPSAEFDLIRVAVRRTMSREERERLVEDFEIPV